MKRLKLSELSKEQIARALKNTEAHEKRQKYLEAEKFAKSKGFQGNFAQLDFFQLLEFVDVKNVTSVGEALEKVRNYLWQDTEEVRNYLWQGGEPDKRNYCQYTIRLFHDTDITTIIEEAHRRKILLPDRRTSEFIIRHLLQLSTSIYKKRQEDRKTNEEEQKIRKILLCLFSQGTISENYLASRICDFKIGGQDLPLVKQFILLSGDPVAKIFRKHLLETDSTSCLLAIEKFLGERNEQRSKIFTELSATLDDSLLSDLCVLIIDYFFPDW